MGKYYAVKNGRKKGIFLTWKECKDQVLGFSNAEYKSFTTQEEAQNYLREKSSIKEELDYDAIAYVDGSFNIKTCVYGYGVIIRIKDKEIKFNERGDDEHLAKHRNVAGEILGAMKAVEIAKKNNCKSIVIYYDYMGIENWAKKTWERNTDLTKRYSEFMEKQIDIKIDFVKVKSHSGNELNDAVDKLAKEAVGL